MTYPPSSHLAAVPSVAVSVADRVSEWLPVLWFLLTVIVLWLLWNSGLLASLIGRMSKFGGFGLSFEFTESSALQTRESVEQGLSAIRTRIRRRLSAEVHSSGLQEAFASLINSTSLKERKGYRATIHIPDPLYTHQLYQLLDYHPKGGGAGRSFSIRTGIIGMAWRHLEPDKWHQASHIDQKELMRQWGMTRAEAQAREAADSKKMFLAVPLFDENSAVPVGVFYLDADSPESLGLSATPPDAADQAAKDAAPTEYDAYLDKLASEVVAAYKAKMQKTLAGLVEKAKAESPRLALEGE